MEYKMIETKIGSIYGRDAIYVDRVEYFYNERKIKITGEMNNTSAEVFADNRFLPFTLEFVGVLSFNSTELDMYSQSKGEDWYKGSFIEVVGSKMLATINHPNKKEFKHLILQSYDDVFEIICFSYKLEIKQLI